MNWFRVQRKLGNNQENFMRYALTTNDVFVSEKNIKPYLLHYS